MVRGPEVGLTLLDAPAGPSADGRLRGDHRVDAVRAHLREMAGDLPGAAEAYRAAAARTASLPQRRYLYARAARLGTGGPGAV
jgi:predicted RNA polymerase sigma factor